jgi:hypothetical protein
MDEVQKRKPKDFTPYATFTFNLQSTTSLEKLGFEDVPSYTPTPPAAKPSKVKKPSKAKKNQAESDANNEDKLEDDAESVIEAMEEDPTQEKELIVVSKPGPEPKTNSNSDTKSKSEPKLKSTPKIPLPSFGPSQTAIEVLSVHSKSISKVNPDKSSGNRIEADKSLNFCRSEMFSEDGAGIEGGQGLGPRPHQLVEEAQTSAFDFSNTDQRKSSVLQGEEGNPAHKAFLARADTQDTESQSESRAESRAESHANTSEAIDETTKDWSALLPSKFQDKTEQTSSRQASQALDIVNISMAETVINQHLVESPEYEPITPPISAKKAAIRQQDVESIIVKRLAATFEELSPGQLRQTSIGQTMNQCTPSNFSQATIASTLGEPSRLPSSSICKAQGNTFNLARASSPAFSEETEVADPMEIMESVKNSQRIGDHSDEFQYQYSPAQLHRSEATHHIIASSILESVKTTVEDASMLDVEPTNVREQVRESWKHISPTPASSFASPQTPKRTREQQDQAQFSADSQTLPKLQTEEKRKADAISDKEAEDGKPRKSTVAPAMRKTESLEQKMMAAKAKLAAATERNHKLEDERQAALLIKKKNDEV